ncbi:16S rRNA (cytosine(1402)-N(4))-methyltransferase RsmH [Flavobacteriaceae bacterium]|jgi:16S rRNA (cytosine1402-N4)-methyltransferase|nr:16S rRNA (cytosine(1402)-N(4))-methyltransferase RsmH [Flavobacteriaceae bacterium]
MMKQYHNPVLLEDALQGLDIRPEGIYVDVTFGGGGHSRVLLDQLNEQGQLFAFDQDQDAHENRIEDSRFQLVAANFSHLSHYLKYHGISSVNGILADFGVSSHQFDQASRGFSTRKEGRLDMRMNQSQTLDAQEVLNQYSEEALSELFFNYGELRNARKLANKIVSFRSEDKLETTSDLIRAVQPWVPQRIENKVLAQIFQAVRIEVNDELGVLKSFLEQAAAVLEPGGRLVCISYHSLEDRLVKRFIQSGNFEGREEKDFYGNSLSVLRKVGKLRVPTAHEVQHNSRARSAKLRIAEKR